VKAPNNTIVMEEVTDPVEIERARAQQQLFDRNWQWFVAQVPAIYETYRGKSICIAGQEVFAADTAKEALELATAAYPHDDGRFVMYIPKEKMVRIYVASWPMAPVH